MGRLAYPLVASVLLLLLAAQPGSGAEIPLLNAGFEESCTDGMPAAWQRGYCHGRVEVCRDEATAHSGSASLRLTKEGPCGGSARQPVGQAGLYPGDPRRLSPGDRLQLSAWYRTSGLQSSGPHSMAQVAVMANAHCMVKVDADPAAGDWRYVEVAAQVPAQAAASGVGDIEVKLWDFSGTIWWDDIRLTRLPAQALDVQHSDAHVPAGGAPAPLALADDQISLTFDRQTGALLTLCSPVTGTAFVAPEPAVAVPVRLAYVSQAPQRLVPTLTAAESQSETGRRAVRFCYEMAEGRIKLNLLVSLAGEGRSEWTVYVRNDSDVTVIGVAWPVLNGLRVGPEGRDDCLVYPWRSGQLVRGPGFEERFKVVTYVGTGSMGWLDLYDEPLREALYVGSHDPSFLDMRMNLTPQGAGGSFGLDFEKYAYVPPGSEWQSEPMVVALHRGDWHQGSKIYTNWAQTVLKPATPPTWLREAFCWDTGEFRPDLWRYEHIPALWDRAVQRGFSAVSYQGQMVLNHCNRFYYPDPLLGTPQELAQRNREVGRRGGRMIYYTNAIGWRRHFADHLPPQYDGLIPAELKPSWEQMAPLVSRHLDGSDDIEYKDEQGDNDWLVMCPATAGWQQHMRFWVVDKYLKEYAAAGMMVDQAAAIPSQPCYDFRHGHRHHGCWGPGLAELLRGIHEAAHSVRPDCCIYIEGRCDYLSQWSDTCMIGLDCNLPEMLRYTFPEILVGYDRSDLDISFLMGGLIQWGARYPNARVDALGKVYHAVADILAYARFVDTDGLGELPEGVRGKVFVHDARGAVLILLSDARKAPAPFCLTVSRDLYRARQATAYYYPEQLGGQRTVVDAHLVGGCVRVDVPPLPNGGQPKVAAVILSPSELPVLEITGPAEVDWSQPFVLTVTSAGCPVPGATVHIGDRAYTTDQKGTVGETFTTEEPDGVWLLTAKKGGYLSARATLRLKGPYSLAMAKVLP